MKGLYLVEYNNEDKYADPEIFLYIRNDDGTKTIKTITNFRPYIYVDEECNIKNKFILKEECGFKSIFGTPVKKLILRHPKNVYFIRQEIEKLNFNHYEADVLFSNRFLIDYQEEIMPTKLKVFTIDIETLSKGGFPDINTANNEIICLTIHNSLNDKFVSLYWNSVANERKINLGKNWVLYMFNSEKKMLNYFIKQFQLAQPDIITGWNVIKFDILYLINRMKRLNLPYHLLSPQKIVRVINDNWGFNNKIYYTPYIKGVILFDMLQKYRMLHKGELSSYSLNNVAKEELGEEKTNTNYLIDNDWKHGHWLKIINYNKQDVSLVVNLDRKLKIINFFDEMRRISHCNLSDTDYFGRMVDSFILYHAKKNNNILPSKKTYQKRKDNEKLSGGLVREIVPNIYNNVCVFDLSSLYPNLIKTFNLSFDSLDNDGNININGVRFTNKRRGLITNIINELGSLANELKKKRNEAKKNQDEEKIKLYKTKYQVAKSFFCTIYGVIALPSFRGYALPVAKSITYLGRSINLWCQDIVKKFGHKVLYGDTDSIFVKIKSDNIIQEGLSVCKKLNESFDDFVKQFGDIKEHTLNIKFEKIYKTLLLGRKKRYAGHIIWDEGNDVDKIDIVGFDSVRSDTAKISKEIQKKVLDMILKNKSKNKIIDYVLNISKEIMDGLYKPSQIGLPVKFDKDLNEYEKTMPKLRGAKWSNENLKTQYGAGDKILMVYVKNNLDTDTVCFEYDYQIENNNIQIDYKQMIEKLVFMKLETIFDACGWLNDLNLLRQSLLKNQTGLNDFS